MLFYQVSLECFLVELIVKALKTFFCSFLKLFKTFSMLQNLFFKALGKLLSTLEKTLKLNKNLQFCNTFFLQKLFQCRTFQNETFSEKKKLAISAKDKLAH